MRTYLPLLLLVCLCVPVVAECSYDRVNGWHFDPLDILEGFFDADSKLDRQQFYQRAEEPFDS